MRGISYEFRGLRILRVSKLSELQKKSPSSEALKTTPYDDPATPYGDSNAVARKRLHLMSLIELRIRLQKHINKI